MKRYGITLAADLYTPKIIKGKLAGLAVGSPYEAVKEQAGGIYAMKMVERGYVILAFDQSFNGESGGNVRLVSSPDINTEDFCASVDYLVCLENVDPEKIGIIGICGFGGLAISAAAMDPRIKATVSSTMGSFDDHNHESRYEERKKLSLMRSKDVQNGNYTNQPILPKPCPKDALILLKIITIFIILKEVIILVLLIRELDGMLLLCSVILLSHFLIMLKKLKVLFYLFMEIKLFLIMLVRKL